MLDQALPLDVFFALSVEKYYKNRENSIGSAGDFITSPETSQMFCHAVGLWVYNQISYVKENISLVELGPGHGTLMNEVLNLLKSQIIINNVYPKRVCYYLAETLQYLIILIIIIILLYITDLR